MFHTIYPAVHLFKQSQNAWETAVPIHLSSYTWFLSLTCYLSVLKTNLSDVKERFIPFLTVGHSSREQPCKFSLCSRISQLESFQNHYLLAFLAPPSSYVFLSAMWVLSPLTWPRFLCCVVCSQSYQGRMGEIFWKVFFASSWENFLYSEIRARKEFESALFLTRKNLSDHYKQKGETQRPLICMWLWDKSSAEAWRHMQEVTPARVRRRIGDLAREKKDQEWGEGLLVCLFCNV